MPAASGTLLTTPSNTLVKTRHRETYVSEGLNKKLNGVLPLGVVRGGNLAPSALNLRVTVEADLSTVDSVYSYIDHNGNQLTHRQAGDVVLDLTALASTSVFIALYIDYTVSADTVVQWRAYTAAQLAAETEAVLVLGEVDVPAAGVIPATDIHSYGRQTGWETISQGMTEWYQVVENGGFEIAKQGALVSGDGQPQPCPGWDTDFGTGLSLNNMTGAIAGVAPRTGNNELEFSMVGNPNQAAVFAYAGFEPIVPGQRVRLSAWLRGTAVPGPGASGHFGLEIAWFDSSFNIIGAEYLDNLSAASAGAYTEITEVYDAPSGVAFVSFVVLYDDDSANSIGSVYFDDVRMWIERNQVRDDHTLKQTLCQGSVRTKSLDLIEEGVFGSGTPLGTIIDRMIQLRSLGMSGGVHDLVMRARDAGTTPFDLLLKNGGLDVERVMGLLGSQFISTANEALTARLSGPTAPGATSLFTLLMEWTSTDTGIKGRVYHGSGGGLYITINAYPTDGTGLSWNRDLGGAFNDSILWAFDVGTVYMWHYSGSDAAPWTIADWLLTTASNYGEVVLDASLEVNRELEVGAELRGSASEYATERIKTWVPDVANGEYVLLYEADHSGIGRGSIRLYASVDSTVSPGEVFAITFNAKWDPTLNAGSGGWSRDTGSRSSHRFDIGNDSVYFYGMLSTEADGWLDTSWDGAPGNGDEFFRIDTNFAPYCDVIIRNENEFQASDGWYLYASDRIGNEVILPGGCFFDETESDPPGTGQFNFERAFNLRMWALTASNRLWSPLFILPEDCEIDEFRIWANQGAASTGFSAEIRYLDLQDGGGGGGGTVGVAGTSIATAAGAGILEAKATAIGALNQKYVGGDFRAYFIEVTAPATIGASDYLMGAYVKYLTKKTFI